MINAGENAEIYAEAAQEEGDDGSSEVGGAVWTILRQPSETGTIKESLASASTANPDDQRPNNEAATEAVTLITALARNR